MKLITSIILTIAMLLTAVRASYEGPTSSSNTAAAPNNKPSNRPAHVQHYDDEDGDIEIVVHVKSKKHGGQHSQSYVINHKQQHGPVASTSSSQVPVQTPSKTGDYGAKSEDEEIVDLDGFHYDDSVEGGDDEFLDLDEAELLSMADMDGSIKATPAAANEDPTDNEDGEDAVYEGEEGYDESESEL